LARDVLSLTARKKSDARSIYLRWRGVYECITGQAAFGGSSIWIGAQVIHVTPPVPSTSMIAFHPSSIASDQAMEKKI